MLVNNMKDEQIQEAMDNEWARQDEMEKKGHLVYKGNVTAEVWNEWVENARLYPDNYIELSDNDGNTVAIEEIYEESLTDDE